MATLSISVRYSGERKFRTVVVGIKDLKMLRYQVGNYAILDSIRDIRITESPNDVEFKVYTL